MCEIKATQQRSSISVESVFQAAGVGLALVDAEGRFLRSNPALQRLLQVSEEELLSRTLLDFCSAQDAPFCYDLIHEVAFCDAKVQEQEMHVALSSGEMRWVHLTASLLQNEEEEACVVLTVQDTSDYFEVQEAIEKSLPQKSWKQPMHGHLNA